MSLDTRPQSSVGPAPVCPHHPSPGQSHTEPYERHGCNHRGRLAPSSQAVPSTGGDLARGRSPTEWKAELILYRLQPILPLQPPLLAGQWLLHRARSRPAVGRQHQPGEQRHQHVAAEGIGAGPADTRSAQHQLLLCSPGPCPACPAASPPGSALGGAENHPVAHLTGPGVHTAPAPGKQHRVIDNFPRPHPCSALGSGAPLSPPWLHQVQKYLPFSFCPCDKLLMFLVTLLCYSETLQGLRLVSKEPVPIPRQLPLLFSCSCMPSCPANSEQ